MQSIHTKKPEVKVSALRITLFDTNTESSAAANQEESCDNNNNTRVSCMAVSSLSDSLDCSYYLSASNKQHQEEDERVADSQRRGISFGYVSCRLYDRTVGVHPAVSSGPALDFEWKYRVADSISVEDYESRKFRRCKSQLVVPRYEREKMLKYQCDVPRQKITDCVREINRTKHKRRQTANNLRFTKLEEKMQKIQRGVSRMLGIRKSYEKELKELWKRAELHSNVDKTISLNESSHRRSSIRSFPKQIICFRKRNSRKPEDLDTARHKVDFDLFGQDNDDVQGGLEASSSTTDGVDNNVRGVDDNVQPPPKNNDLDQPHQIFKNNCLTDTSKLSYSQGTKTTVSTATSKTLSPSKRRTSVADDYEKKAHLNITEDCNLEYDYDDLDYSSRSVPLGVQRKVKLNNKHDIDDLDDSSRRIRLGYLAGDKLSHTPNDESDDDDDNNIDDIDHSCRRIHLNLNKAGNNLDKSYRAIKRRQTSIVAAEDDFSITN